jgi:hypothetical protein
MHLHTLSFFPIDRLLSPEISYQTPYQSKIHDHKIVRQKQKFKFYLSLTQQIPKYNKYLANQLNDKGQLVEATS